MAGLAVWQTFNFKTNYMYYTNYNDSLDGSNNRTVEVQKVLEQIKKGFWKKQIEDIQYQVNSGNTKQANELKLKLPAFTISATYKGKRKKENVESYSGLLHLDYDKLDNVQDIKSKIISNPYTYAAFVSPSGKGLKVLVKCDNDLSAHTYAFNALRSYYDSFLEVESDKSVKDVLRLCFVSYDSDMYLDKNSRVFKYLSYPNNETSSQKDLDWIWDFTAKKEGFYEGNRNNFIHLYGCNANRHGFQISDVINYAYSYSDSEFTKEEIEQSITSAYENNISEKGSVAKPAISAISIKSMSESGRSPYIPDSVYDNLPEILKEACNVFKGRERDIFLTSALSIISGGLYNVHGLYANEKVYPNLYSFVIAPPASGKGSMKYARQLGECYHNILLAQSKGALKAYGKAKRNFDLKLKKAKTNEAIDALEEPIKPESKMFFIPADTSSAMIVNHLQDNDGMGCICETEADTLTNALKKEWGSFSDVLRKGLHAESISKSRITDLEYIEVKEPKFSVAVTGTPNQLGSLISSVQDGLFSRFMFYSFVSEPVWKSTYTAKLSISKKTIFEDFSTRLCDKFKSNKSQMFWMTRIQGEKLDRVFKDSLEHNTALYNDDVPGIVFRLGLMSFKIAMVLSALRSEESEITCSDDDFKTAIDLVEKVYIQHSIGILNGFNKNPKELTLTQKRLLVWIKTKDSFKRSEILIEAKKLNIKERTLGDILNRFLDLKLIIKTSHGTYKKK